MKLKVNRLIWEDLGLDDANNMRIARAYFYLGFGIHATRSAIKLGAEHEEVKRYLEIARDCGLNFDDYIIDLGA